MEIDELERRLNELSASEIAYKDGMSKSTDAQCARLGSQGLPMPSPACRVA